jgi:hypothetical protein
MIWFAAARYFSTNSVLRLAKYGFSENLIRQHVLNCGEGGSAPDCHAEHAVLNLRFYGTSLKFHFEGLFVEDRIRLVVTVDKVEIGDFIHDFGRR